MGTLPIFSSDCPGSALGRFLPLIRHSLLTAPVSSFLAQNATTNFRFLHFRRPTGLKFQRLLFESAVTPNNRTNESNFWFT
jgi:hypothetical protein